MTDRLKDRRLEVAALVLGWVILIAISLQAFGGASNLWKFGLMEPHRFTSMAMLSGSLRLRNALSGLLPDEQVFNGAGYTNWGFGVPLLQAPFHAAARRLGWGTGGFFPDRAIFFFYFCICATLAWLAYERLLSKQEVPGWKRIALSWAAALMTLSLSLYPLMSCRFIVYEETIAYFAVAQLIAMSAWILARDSWDRRWLAVLCVAAGLGLLVRQTGLLYLGVWLILVAAESRSRAVVLGVLAGLVPFLCAWMWTNTVRSGGPLAFGLMNSLPWSEFHTAMQQFGSQCNDTFAHAVEVAANLFRILFFNSRPARSDWLNACHFSVEPRQMMSAGTPLLGPSTLVFLVAAGVLGARRRAPLAATLAPFLGLFALFGSFVYAGAGLNWRYAGDFWPLIIMVGVQTAPSIPRRALGLPLALAFCACSAYISVSQIQPTLPSLGILGERQATLQSSLFLVAQTFQDPPLPSDVACGSVPRWLLDNGRGWHADCRVDAATQVYLGIPESGAHRLEFVTDGKGAVAEPSLGVYVNGKILTARREADSFVVDVDLPRAQFHSPIVMTTVRWSKLAVPNVRLLAVKLR